MNGLVAFRLTRNGRPIGAAVELGSAEQVGQEAGSPVIEDIQPCGFEVVGREPDVEYRVWVGDRGPIGSGDAGPGQVAGVGRGTTVVWDDARHLDGARGLVWVRLASRTGGDDPWKWRARMPVYVRSTKLSEDRHRSMTTQVRRLASGLLFDLVSPMLRSLGTTDGRGGVSHRSGQEELRLLERLWAVVSPALLEIERNPVTRLTRIFETRLSWGGERLGPGALARLVAAGTDPRHPSTPRPLSVLQDRLHEVVDTPEHRAIAGLLRFLQERVSDCARDILSHRRAIEDDRTLRERIGEEAASLFETEDRPRTIKLGNALDRAERLASSIRQARALPLFSGLAANVQFPSTPVFEHVRPYRTIRDQFLRYSRASLLIIEEGADERIKTTHRLYEQWIFFQIAAAFHAAGLTCISQEGLFHRSHRFRYTLDVDRGARLTFLAKDQRAVVLRFEPWILPADLARQRRESIYRGRSGESAWSPDVLIEFLDGPEAGRSSGTVGYAVVLDAKYTARLQEHHWSDVLKYMDIKSTHNRRQVVKQVWLAYLDEDEPIAFEDTDLTWPDDLTGLSPDDSARGRLGLLPQVELPEDEGDGLAGWIPAPEAVAREFVEHLLRSRGILPHP
jgi:hypothetical protein